MTCYIYSITHISSGKLYIGSTTDIYSRWAIHKCRLKGRNHPNRYLQSAWNKYGESQFEFEIIEEVLDTDKMIGREQYWMDKLQSYNRQVGFNFRVAAQSNIGFKHTEETIERMRLARLGKYPSKKTRQKMSLARLGTHPSEETRKKMSLTRLGRHHSDETRQKLSLAARSRKHL
ncbi:MAG: GIY-YIG nuclease family protein [bacterium]